MHGGMRLKLRRIYCGLNQMNDLMPDLPRRVILFTKVPLPGQVKTRLMTCLSAEECASLQSSFIKDIVRACLESDAGLYIFYAPAEEITPLKECVPDSARLYRLSCFSLSSSRRKSSKSGICLITASHSLTLVNRLAATFRILF